MNFKGDRLGFDGIATGRCGCDAVAMDTGEDWSFRRETLLQACTEPALMALVRAAMSREIARDRDSLLSLCTLPADAPWRTSCAPGPNRGRCAACAPTRSRCG
ncbi:hypothetical protein M8A51_20740 [Schlegelella sp. S2-27]|uniref:Uncharacterized protein n=1 Tax=Caldimonas mangrovi TaxID=2944811 RepID=A0ABT0YUK5_9BURK|nr:hypothetical protein [Caldimonas mangrovi]MCM5681962.1 hypothetical protein [Caldimonas mangrovi]